MICQPLIHTDETQITKKQILSSQSRENPCSSVAKKMIDKVFIAESGGVSMLPSPNASSSHVPCDTDRIKMRVSKFVCFGVGAMMAATATWADEVTIVSNLLGPEGPLYVEGNLYYVSWVSNTL